MTIGKAERYEQIRHLRDRVTSRGPRYAEAHYEIRLDDETRQLSNDDLILLCDRGNACFGGSVRSRVGLSAYVIVFTD